MVPDRELVTNIGLDDDDNFIKLWAVEWRLRGEMVGQTAWCVHPTQAMKLADQMDNDYQQVLDHCA